MSEHRDWLIDRYDTEVEATAEQGSQLEKSRDAVAHQYADAVESGELDRADLVTEGRALFDRDVLPLRERRKSTLISSAEYLLEALANATILGREDPILKKAFPLGNGIDKALIYWEPDDWRGAIYERLSNAAKVSAAADRFRDVGERIIDALISLGVRNIDEFLPPDQAGPVS